MGIKYSTAFRLIRSILRYRLRTTPYRPFGTQKNVTDLVESLEKTPENIFIKKTKDIN